jgi:uncharacterized protein
MRGRATFLAAVVLVASGTGCFLRARQDPARYYTLVALAESAPAASRLRVGLGPITLPGYLDRPELATRVDPERVRYSAFDRWAEPLPRQLERILGEDLGRALGTVGIVAYPWYPSVPLDVAVRVNVLAFELDAGGVARLEAAWTLRDPGTARVFRQGRSSFAEPVAPGGADTAVAALSRALARLAAELAAAIEATTSAS